MHAKVSLPAGLTLQDLKTKEVELAWDIHETIARKKKSECAVLTIKNLPTLVSKAGSLRKGIKEVKKQGGFVAAEAYAGHFHKEKNVKLAQYIEKVSNAYAPIQGIEEIITQLSNKGYTHRLASNIGKNYLPILEQRFVGKYKCRVFSHMKGGTIIDYKVPNMRAGKTLIKAPLQYATQCKPHHNLYEIHNKVYNPDNRKIIVFVDDKKENIEAANKNGWVGILFVNTKQLKKDLQYLGLL
ncbi:hypothetical protein Noda2021_08930 [Candidatus Dependentiae bacterium Noda2021]|nr:hypothetical protein Noda2021_08930 [Candidatus Dependentiae bacterium Noda2021]